MNDEEPPRPKGIETNIKAPQIDTVDIYDKDINLSELLKDLKGVLIVFFFKISQKPYAITCNRNNFYITLLKL